MVADPGAPQPGELPEADAVTDYIFKRLHPGGDIAGLRLASTACFNLAKSANTQREALRLAAGQVNQSTLGDAATAFDADMTGMNGHLVHFSEACRNAGLALEEQAARKERQQHDTCWLLI